MVLYDFVKMNYYLSECIQLEKEIKHNFDFIDLDALAICIKRSSQDTSVDNHGNKLLLLYQIMQI